MPSNDFAILLAYFFRIFYTISMRTLLEKTVLYLACSGLCLWWQDITLTTIVFLLICLIIGCIPTLLKKGTDYPAIDSHFGHGKELPVIYTCFLALSLFFPCLVYFLPLILYDLVEQNLWICCGFCAFSLVIFGSMAYNSGSLALFILCLLSALLSLEHKHARMEGEKFIHLQDSATEHDLLLQKSNQRLKEAQDANIYMATIQERNRIAREIHDNVGHLLTRSLLQTGAIETLNKDETLAPAIASLRETLNTAMTNIRESVHDMHDEAVNLASALKNLTEEVSAFPIHLTYDCKPAMDKTIKYAFIAITKEAINNAVKHSNCTEMSILLREHPSFYQFVIQDNGTNISIEDTSGIGLNNMQERIKEVHGTMQISTEHGFRIYITIMKQTGE